MRKSKIKHTKIKKDKPERIVEYFYENHYRCETCKGHNSKHALEWIDEHDCMCNDRCPDCDSEIEPYESVETKTITEIRVIDHTRKTFDIRDVPF